MLQKRRLKRKKMADKVGGVGRELLFDAGHSSLFKNDPKFTLFKPAIAIAILVNIIPVARVKGIDH